MTEQAMNLERSGPDGENRPRTRPCRKCGTDCVCVAADVAAGKPVPLDLTRRAWVLFRDPDGGRLYCWKASEFAWRLQQLGDADAVLAQVAGLVGVYPSHADVCRAAGVEEAGKAGTA